MVRGAGADEARRVGPVPRLRAERGPGRRGRARLRRHDVLPDRPRVRGRELPGLRPRDRRRVRGRPRGRACDGDGGGGRGRGAGRAALHARGWLDRGLAGLARSGPRGDQEGARADGPRQERVRDHEGRPGVLRRGVHDPAPDGAVRRRARLEGDSAPGEHAGVQGVRDGRPWRSSPIPSASPRRTS